MDIGNEKQNKAANQSAGLGTKRQGQWRAVCGPDQRFYFVKWVISYIHAFSKETIHELWIIITDSNSKFYKAVYPIKNKAPFDVESSR